LLPITIKSTTSLWKCQARVRFFFALALIVRFPQVTFVNDAMQQFFSRCKKIAAKQHTPFFLNVIAVGNEA
jgi:hypothetical protein